MASIKQGREGPWKFALHFSAVGLRGARIATFGTLAGCCAQTYWVSASPRAANKAAAIIPLPMNVRRSITASPFRREESKHPTPTAEIERRQRVAGCGRVEMWRGGG